MTVKHRGPKVTLQKLSPSQPLKTRTHLREDHAVTAKFLFIDTLLQAGYWTVYWPATAINLTAEKWYYSHLQKKYHWLRGSFADFTKIPTQPGAPYVPWLSWATNCNWTCGWPHVCHSSPSQQSKPLRLKSPLRSSLHCSRGSLTPSYAHS